MKYIKSFSNLIIKYDPEENKFTVLDPKLPLNIQYPSIANYNDECILLGGGESHIGKLNNITYDLHPNNFLKISFDDDK